MIQDTVLLHRIQAVYVGVCLVTWVFLRYYVAMNIKESFLISFVEFLNLDQAIENGV